MDTESSGIAFLVDELYDSAMRRRRDLPDDARAVADALVWASLLKTRIEMPAVCGQLRLASRAYAGRQPYLCALMRELADALEARREAHIDFNPTQNERTENDTITF